MSGVQLVQGDITTAPADAMTDELLAAVDELAPTVVREYHERNGILLYDARTPQQKAPRPPSSAKLLGRIYCWLVDTGETGFFWHPRQLSCLPV